MRSGTEGEKIGGEQEIFFMTVTGLNMGRLLEGAQAGRTLVICATRGARDQGGVAPCYAADPHPPRGSLK